MFSVPGTPCFGPQARLFSARHYWLFSKTSKNNVFQLGKVASDFVWSPWFVAGVMENMSPNYGERKPKFDYQFGTADLLLCLVCLSSVGFSLQNSFPQDPSKSCSLPSWEGHHLIHVACLLGIHGRSICYTIPQAALVNLLCSTWYLALRRWWPKTLAWTDDFFFGSVGRVDFPPWMPEISDQRLMIGSKPPIHPPILRSSWLKCFQLMKLLHCFQVTSKNAAI